MHILAFDTALDACSVALLDSARDQISAHRQALMRTGQAEALPGMIKAALAEAGLCFKDLDAIAVTTGPGTFTGVRIGLAMARGLALALDIPAVGITSLEAVAHGAAAGPNAAGTNALAVVFDARRSEVYAQMFAGDARPLGNPQLIAVSALPGLLPKGQVEVAGSGTNIALGLAGPDHQWRRSPASPRPDARLLARTGARHLTGTGPPAPPGPPQPVYLRAPDAKVQKPLLGAAAKP